MRENLMDFWGCYRVACDDGECFYRVCLGGTCRMGWLILEWVISGGALDLVWG